MNLFSPPKAPKPQDIPPPPTPPDISAQLSANQQRRAAIGSNLGGTYMTGGKAWAPRTAAPKTLTGL